MADPVANGDAASARFLAENKTKPGVITLESGLQYKVLVEGRGMEHPKDKTKCECHYAGRLLDGTEFDSSYRRGKPAIFALHLVIKGWTEAMQLMVEGDKWELYVPWELAYGAAGNPPNIPPKAALLFIVQLVKIRGESVPANITFPEWTAEQLALWEPKDEEACQKWREAKEKSWEDGKFREKYHTREEFTIWLDKQCLSSKNKSLWKRTRQDYEKDAPPVTIPGSKLTAVTARKMLTKAILTFKVPENKVRFEGLIKECEADVASSPMLKMSKVIPAVTSMLTGLLQEYGFGPLDLMKATMEINAFATADTSIAADVEKLMKAGRGDLSGLL